MPYDRRALADGTDDRRLADDTVLAVDDLAELGEGLQAVAGVRLRVALLDELQALLGRHLAACAAAFLEAFLAFLPFSLLAGFAAASSAPTAVGACQHFLVVSWVYQMSMRPIWANSAMALRYAFTDGQRGRAHVLPC